MDIDEVVRDLLGQPRMIGDDESIWIYAKYKDGSIEMPFRFDWYLRLVGHYGIEDATRFACMIVRKWWSG